MDPKRNLQGLLFLIVFSFTATLWISCGEAPPPPKDEEITTDTASVQAKVALDQIFVNIPPPMELSKELSKGGLNYNKSLLNPSTRSSSYTTNLKAAANLGAYGADLSYTIAYGQTQDALGYLNAIRQLADKVGVGAAFDENMIKRFEGNVSNKDTMEAIISDAYDKASRNLRSNERVSTAAVVAAGGWVEGLHITVQALNGVPKEQKNEQAFQRVWNQVYAYKYIEELLNLYKNNPDCAQMLKDLEPMKELVDIYTKQVTVKEDEIKALSEKLTPIRNSMIN